MAIRWWLGLDTSGGSLCPFCPGVALDMLGHHAASCKHGGDVVARHNDLRDIFAAFCRGAHLSVKVEVAYGLGIGDVKTPAQQMSLFRTGTEENQLPLM